MGQIIFLFHLAPMFGNTQKFGILPECAGLGLALLHLLCTQLLNAFVHVGTLLERRIQGLAFTLQRHLLHGNIVGVVFFHKFHNAPVAP